MGVYFFFIPESFNPKHMYKFLSISIINGETQIVFLVIHKEQDVVPELIKFCHDYPKTIFFPIMNEEDVTNVSTFITEEWKVALSHEVNQNQSAMGLNLRNQCVRVRSIEHIDRDVFNIMSDSGIFTVNHFIPCITYDWFS